MIRNTILLITVLIVVSLSIRVIHLEVKADNSTNVVSSGEFPLCPEPYRNKLCGRIPCAYKIICGCSCPDARCNKLQCRTTQ